MLTLEMAADLILREDDSLQIDLFEVFVDYFRLQNQTQILRFAELCGFTIGTNVIIFKNDEGEEKQYCN